MAVPKKRTSSTKRNMRRSHHAMTRRNLTACAQCRNLILMHMACPHCGTYRGRAVIDVTAALDKKERKRKEKQRTSAGS